MDDRRKFANIRKKMATIAKEDGIEALLAIEEDLGTLTVVRKYKWDDYLYSKLPRSQLPTIDKNTEIINEILTKSWETQGSVCPRMNPSKVLVTSRCYAINGLLMYYFKNLNIEDKMRRVIGSVRGSIWFVYSFMAFDLGDQRGDHFIDNTFSEGEMKLYQQVPNKAFEFNLKAKYYDSDPASPELNVNPKSSLVGLMNERLVYGPDEKAEQIFVFHSATELNDQAMAGLSDSMGLALYDIKMRQFIKEKYGVEIENLAKKWSKLCWSCFVPSQDLKKCSKCRISRYCGKNCQVQDWKVHKIIHERQRVIILNDPCTVQNLGLMKNFNK